MFDRRSFIGMVAGLLVAGATPGRAARSGRIGDIGVQLYTLRHELQRDFEGTLKNIAAIGYREVEFVDLFRRSPGSVRAILDRLELVTPSSHVSYSVLGDRWPETLETATILGQSFIVCPWIDADLRRQPNGWKHAAEKFNRAGEASKARDPVRVSQS